jgi:hypothetical protein
MSNQFETPPPRDRSNSYDSESDYDDMTNTPPYPPPSQETYDAQHDFGATGANRLQRERTQGLNTVRGALFNDDDFHPTGVAYQIHNKYKEIDAPKVLEFLQTKDPTDYSSVDNIVSEIRPTLLNLASEDDKPQLTDILNKLELATNTRNDIENKNFMGKIVKFISTLYPEFKTQYMRKVITDCSTAYGLSEEDKGYVYDKNNISCPDGIIERFIMSLGYVAMQLDSKNGPVIYKEIIKAFEKSSPAIDISKLFEDWSKTLDDILPDADAEKDFIIYAELQNENISRDEIVAALNKAPLYESYYKDVFQNKQLGGGTRIRRKKRTLKKRKTKLKTKKRIKLKFNKTRVKGIKRNTKKRK